MIVMHGKWGGPRFLDGFARAMAPACEAKSIEMPWSGRRAYDAGYPAALQEISAQIKAFRAQGYRKDMGVKGAVAVLFQQRFQKSKKAATSNWASERLSESQLLYAANDAYAAFRVWEALQRPNF